MTVSHYADGDMPFSKFPYGGHGCFFVSEGISLCGELRAAVEKYGCVRHHFSSIVLLQFFLFCKQFAEQIVHPLIRRTHGIDGVDNEIRAVMRAGKRNFAFQPFFAFRHRMFV